jgi:lysyl-tRNA synthetase class 2
MPLDEHLLAALDAGMPDCAGVALGLDRLLMVFSEALAIGDILSFDFHRV